MAASRCRPGARGNSWGRTQIGRDLFSRLLDGARISMSVAIVVQIVVITIGVPVGAIAGWFGGRADNLLMRLVDVIYAFPDLLFIILLSVAFKDTAFGKAIDGLLLVFVAIGLTTWVTVARLVRGQMLALKETEFVEAAKAIGVPDRKIVTKHLLPNGIGRYIRCDHPRHPGGHPRGSDAPPISASASRHREPPGGARVADGQKLIRSAPHLVLFPSLCIAIALISFTFLGDGLRDTLTRSSRESSRCKAPIRTSPTPTRRQSWSCPPTTS